jgi:hypothetical protein
MFFRENINRDVSINMRYNQLDSIRGLAALMVLFSHFLFIFTAVGSKLDTNYGIFLSFIWNGYSAVWKISNTFYITSCTSCHYCPFVVKIQIYRKEIYKAGKDFNKKKNVLLRKASA